MTINRPSLRLFYSGYISGVQCVIFVEPDSINAFDLCQYDPMQDNLNTSPESLSAMTDSDHIPGLLSGNFSSTLIQSDVKP